MLLKLNENSDGDKFRRFFWSSYYADDALTGIIRANKFFLAAQKREGLSRLEAFAEILAEAPVPLDAHAAGVRISNEVSRETDAMLTAPSRAAGP